MTTSQTHVDPNVARINEAIKAFTDTLKGTYTPPQKPKRINPKPIDIEKALELYQQGFNVSAIATQLNASGAGIYKVIHKNLPPEQIRKRIFLKLGHNKRGGSRTGAGRPTRVDRARLIELLKQGLTTTEIANTLGCCVDTVYQIIRECKLQHLYAGRRTPRKVSREQVADLLKQGRYPHQIAMTLGCKVDVVYKIMRTEKLQHLYVKQLRSGRPLGAKNKSKT